MSKQQNDAAKAARDRSRRISRALVLSTRTPGGCDAPPARAGLDHGRAEIRGEALASHTKFINAETHCKRAIFSARKNERSDEANWVYLKKRWSKVLRPELKRAFADCKAAGMAADELADLRHQMKVQDKEWGLICQLREPTLNRLPSVPAEARDTSTSRGAKTQGILEAIDQLWPNGIPKGLVAKDRDNAIRRRLEENKSSVPQNLARAVKRALKARRRG